MAAQIHSQVFGDIGETFDSFHEETRGPNVKVWVVRTGVGEPVYGYAMAYVGASGKGSFLTWMAMDPQVCRRGLGTLLIQGVLKDLKDSGSSDVELHTRNRFRSAIRLYLRCEFDIVGTHVGTDGELMVRMRKVFAPPGTSI